MAEKITMKVGFERAKAVFEQKGDADMVAFFEKRIEQVNKRATTERKLTPHQLENERIKEALVTEMEQGKLYSIPDMLTSFNCFPDNMTPNRLSALLSQLRGEGQVRRSEIKGRAYFELGNENED